MPRPDIMNRRPSQAEVGGKTGPKMTVKGGEALVTKFDKTRLTTKKASLVDLGPLTADTSVTTSVAKLRRASDSNCCSGPCSITLGCK